MKKVFWISLLGLVSMSSMAGGIRTVSVNSKMMKTVYLKMGQATVLRFREKPKKVILGNSNYFNVEFIDNDLTIQPQGVQNTNLFVYGEYHTFGFNLKVSQNGRFDDLVKVRWQASKARVFGSRAKKSAKTQFREIKKSFSLGEIKFHLKRVQQNGSLNSTILDLQVENLSKKKLQTEELSVFLTRSKKRLQGQQFAFRKDEIKAKGKTELRIVIKPRQTKGFSIEVENGKDKLKQVVSRRFL